MIDKSAPPRLSVARLMLTDFRNVASETFSPSPLCAVLTGANGSGKTNLLEAISLLGPGKGLRGATSAELTRHGAPGWSVSAKLLSDGAIITVGTGLAPADGRRRKPGRIVKIDGVEASSSNALEEACAVLWLTPAMDGLFTGPASERRRFLDRLTAACHPSHRGMMARYDLAMRQRNRLLETGQQTPRLFDSYERQMGEAGVAIAAARAETVSQLSALIGERRNGAGAFPWAQIAIEGELEGAIGLMAAVDIEDEFVRRLGAFRDRDRICGRTSSGPHSSDFAVIFGPKDMPARLCSTGEQKALLIGLILAQAGLVKRSRGGQAPIILLDEIAAHLDETRRAALFEELLKLESQCWMTGTDAENFLPLGAAAQYFAVTDGAVAPFHPQRPGNAGRASGAQPRPSKQRIEAL